MRIVFIYNGTESLGIEHLSSFLRSKGHETFLVFDSAVFSGEVFVNNEALARFCNSDGNIVRDALALNPDLVAFSSFTGNYRWGLGMAEAVKRASGVPIVFGGVHPTAVPERVLANPCVDFVVAGEGEHALLEIVERLSEPDPGRELLKTDNVCLKHGGAVHLNKPRPYIRDLDSLPFPDKALFFGAEPFFRKNPYMITTSRGCPYNCTYCSNNMYRTLYSGNTAHVRRRSVDNVIEELVYAKKTWGMRRVTFMDDVFTLQKPWLEEFVGKYRKLIDRPFYCYTNPLSLTRDSAALLKEGGCYLAGMGVQSGSERIRKEIFNRTDSNARIIEAASYLKADKIGLQMDHIFGAPSETEEDLQKSLDLYLKAKPDMILPFWLTYYPRTRIIAAALKTGEMTEEGVAKIEEGHIGYTHGTGSVKDPAKVRLYQDYELLLQVAAITHSERLSRLFSRIVRFVPFKKGVSQAMYAFLGLAHNREVVLNKFLYAFRELYRAAYRRWTSAP